MNLTDNDATCTDACKLKFKGFPWVEGFVPTADFSIQVEREWETLELS